MSRTRERGERIALRIFWVTLTLPVFYLLSACIVFDFTRQAAIHCQETDDLGRAVSHGPLPDVRICRPLRYDIPGGASWSGREWAFTAYRPVCSLWLRWKGLERADRCGG